MDETRTAGGDLDTHWRQSKRETDVDSEAARAGGAVMSQEGPRSMPTDRETEVTTLRMTTVEIEPPSSDQ